MPSRGLSSLRDLDQPLTTSAKYRSFAGKHKLAFVLTLHPYSLLRTNPSLAMPVSKFKHLLQEPPASTTPTDKPTEGFEVLIDRAAALLVASSMSNGDEKRAQRLHEQARNCMIQAAHSPFFGGTKTAVSYEGLDAIRELVFERMREEFSIRGYPMPVDLSALTGSP